MLHSVIRSTPRWFDTTPAGRVTNRFSRDQETIDGQLAQSLRVVATWGAALIGAIVMVTAIVPAFLIRQSSLVSSLPPPSARTHLSLLLLTAAVFISYAYLYFSKAYIRVGRDLRRSGSIAAHSSRSAPLD